MNDWGLTDKGFKRPDYNDLLDAAEVEAKGKFGSGIKLTARSVFGIFLRLFAWFASKIWEAVEAVYNAAYVDSADGISLYRLGKYIGIRPLNAQKAVGRLNIKGMPSAVIRAGFLVSANNGQRFVTVENVTLDENGAGSVTIQAYVPGPDGNVKDQSILDIVTPITGVWEVTNAEPTVGGRDKETEQEFRERYERSTDIAGGSNADAIHSELLKVPVDTATVFENDTDATDTNGLPPHSVECVVYGGSDMDIARAIFSRKAAGIQTHGAYSVAVIDASGRTQEICFSRPIVRDIWIRISGLLTTDAFGADGKESITNALIGYVGHADGSIRSGLAIGEDVIYNRLLCPVNGVSGVVDYTLEVGVDGESWSKENIAIQSREKAALAPDRVVFLP